MEVLRRDGTSWIRVDDAGNAGTALRLCPFSAEVDDEPARHFRDKKIPIFLDDSTRSAHGMTHLPPRDHCNKGFAMEDDHRRRDNSKATTPVIQLDYMFLGTTAGQDSTEASSMVTILHVVDIETLMRTAVVGLKGIIEHVSQLS